MEAVRERFLKYVKVDTESKHDATTVPSTEKQKDLGLILVREMTDMGIQDVYMSDEGCVFGTIPANYEPCSAPVVGLLAHLDTSPDLTGKNVKPSIIYNYDGNDILLNKEKNIIMKIDEFEHLSKYVGQDLIVTDGTTLLGGDDKAGIAEIMTMAEYLINNPDIKHGTIKIGFTTDEEVGSKGVDNFDVGKFGADFGYTVDGSSLGEICYETFNAADAKIIIHGISIHPGAAKNKMVNSILIAMELNDMLPGFETPGHTEKREGYYHITDFQGTVEKTYMKYIVRDHDNIKFEKRKERFIKIVNYLNEKYGNVIELELKDSYYNMGNKIQPIMYIVDNVKAVLKEMNIEPVEVAMRGGTDGSALSYKGLPCPNISAGYHNAHGRYEYISIQSMEKIVTILINIIKSYVK